MVPRATAAAPAREGLRLEPQVFPEASPAAAERPAATAVMAVSRQAPAERSDEAAPEGALEQVVQLLPEDDLEPVGQRRLEVLSERAV